MLAEVNHPGASLSTAPSLSEETVRLIDIEIGRFPERRSAMMNILHLVQEDLGFIPDDLHPWIADRLGVKPVQVMEVVTFYPMYRREPAGRVQVVVCRTLSCALCGSYAVKDKLVEALGAPLGGTSADGNFSLEFGECLGSCGSAPVVHAHGRLYERVNPEAIGPLVEELRSLVGTPIDTRPELGTPAFNG